MTDADGVQFRLDIPFAPRWQHAELLRVSVLHCLAAVFQNHDFCEQLGTVAAELVENAIQHGEWTRQEGHPFRLLVVGRAGQVIVEVTNPIEAGSTNAFRLKKTMERLEAAGSARKAYMDRLLEIANDPDQPGNGLGLLRIAYETNCMLDIAVHDRHVSVGATIRGIPAAA